MLQSRYESERNGLISNFPEKLSIKAGETFNGQFNMVSAGLLNYLPSIPFEEHGKIYRDILLYKKLSALEQGFNDVLNYVENEGLTPGILTLLTTRPAIICTFHTGSYRLINHFLLNNKIPYTLVAGKTVLAEDGKAFSSLYHRLYPDLANSFKLIDAEAPTSALQMLRELKRGRSLLVYIDGNTGAGGQTIKNINNCTVNFLQQQVYARKGMSYLSHTAGVPIIPIGCYRYSLEKIRLKFFEPILPTATIHRDTYAEETTQRIFDMLSSIVNEYTSQWEGWLYLHKTAKIINRVAFSNSPWLDSSTENIFFNSKFFGILKINNNTYLFSKNSYSFYQVRPGLNNILSGNIDASALKGIPVAFVKELFEIGALRYG